MRIGEPFNPFRMFRGIWIPEALCRFTGLSAGAKLAYGRLCRYGGEGGLCTPAVTTLAREIGIRERQARTYLAQLADQGFIRRVAREGKSSQIEFLWHSVFEVEPMQESAALPRQDSAGVPRQDSAAHPGSILPQKRVNKRRTPQSEEKWGTSFDEWWGIYPRKISKADARRAFEKIVVQGSSKNGLAEDLCKFADFTGRHSQLMKATSVYADGEFATRPDDKIPYPATFINRGDWLSLPEQPKQRELAGFRRSWE